MRAPLVEYGLFCLFHSAVRAVFHASQVHIALDFHSPLAYWGKGSECEDDMLTCYMENKGCALTTADVFKQDEYQRKIFPQPYIGGRQVGENELDYGRWGHPNGVRMFANSGVSMYHVMKPSKIISEKFLDVKSKIGWEHDFQMIGLHVRRGDACKGDEPAKKGRACDDLHVCKRVSNCVGTALF